ncbi:RagB/SusD family nutrient uptake outer membrane protein [Aestuariibaculum sp. M13]|uniref:RagB/SusD family nutrient uptake outer membrane protein n=1 Tax=Aestuariibaculum sp. M13 TaxID=2967132 RepID=UPI002159E8DE|nr:RagB/SusD family nutrient uptake outer membrane protein [Aestuariibaculum sp. M13]MCR8669014.1 RagB/SusD family nutrient uptake outer membrane protein [Aestuariibaculum sp. M13]
MKVYIKHIITLIMLVVLVSCDDYLDIKPEDKFLEEQVFESKKSILAALNGIYTNMASPETYGGNLTMSAVDLLGQQYKTPGENHSWYGIAHYDYEDPKARSAFNSIWSTQYATILALNNFLTGLEMYPGVLTVEEENIVKGEAYGLRAMLHFDLLRLYGPVYSVSPEKEAIPYSLDNSGNTLEFLSASEVIKLVLTDLELAETFLENDAIISEGPADLYGFGDPGLEILESEADKLNQLRQYRFNYYAVKALQARVNLYAGNKTEALQAAKYIIDNASQWFPWTDEDKVFDSNDPDRTFSTEVIFGLINTDLYGRQIDYFTTNRDQDVLTADYSILLSTFETLQDYRFTTTWIVPQSGRAYHLFYKYADVANKDHSDFRFKQPLIRMTEMYYIAAETEPDPAVAAEYINTVRANRGVAGDIEPSNLQNEIFKEYKKEFYGEGQLFFYYKRLNVPTINSGTQGVSPYTMGADQYVVPLPLSETDYRN